MRAVLKNAKPKDLISLAELASLWGTSKQRFVTKRPEFIDFPDPVEKVGNAFLYAVKPCVQAMINHIDRHQKASTTKAKRLEELIGLDQMAEHIHGDFSMAELAKANQMATELEAREREQGLYVPIAEIQRDIGMVFSEISELMSNLSNIVDPHGKLPPENRALIDKNGHDQLLRLHKTLKRMLSPDVVEGPNRRKNARARKAPARRQRKASSPRKAG